MNVLIASDKFKDALSAQAVGEALAKGILSECPNYNVNIHPLADGGDGSLAVIQQYLSLSSRTVKTQDPLGRSIQATYLWSGQTAYIELAAASGIALLAQNERNPLLTSTYGTGLLIKDAIEQGCCQIYLFLGGSATNDLGFGIAAALGFEFFTTSGKQAPSASSGKLIPCGQILELIGHVEAPVNKLPKDFEIIMLCDVTNPLFGPQGAAYVYAPQKGASPEMVKRLDHGLRSSNALLEKEFGAELTELRGGGAAGGVAAGLYALLPARIQSGFKLISDLSGLDQAIRKADLIISGEGKLDKQSLDGKVVGGIVQYSKQHQKDIQLVVGTSRLNQVTGVSQIWAVDQLAANRQDSIEHTAKYLQMIGRAIGKKSKSSVENQEKID